MDRYQKVEKPKLETPIDENEIRITSQGRMRSYITYAMALLQEKDQDEILFKAMGRAINKTVTMVELIKRRIAGLHQITAIQSIDITDTWEPLEEGLQTLETTRKVSMITITLSKKELEKTNLGYQPPIPADQVKVYTELDYDGEGSPSGRGRGRFGRGRGGRGRPRGNGFGSAEYEDGGYERNRGYNRGTGRGRGRNFHDRLRGGYNNTWMEPQNDGYNHDAEGYNQEAPRDTGNGFGSAEYEDGGYERNRDYTRGTGRGRGRNFRDRLRGGYNNPPMEPQNDAEGYNQEAPRGNGLGSAEYEDGGYERNRDYTRGMGRGRGRNFRDRLRGGYNNPPMEPQNDAEGYNQEAPRGNGFGSAEYEDGGYERNRGYNRGTGRGRGRHFRDRLRGGYNNPPMEPQNDAEGYNQEAPRGRGWRRGWGRGGGFRSNALVHAAAGGA